MAFVNIEQIKVIIFRRLIFFVKFSSFEGKGKKESISLNILMISIEALICSGTLGMLVFTLTKIDAIIYDKF